MRTLRQIVAGMFALALTACGGGAVSTVPGKPANGAGKPAGSVAFSITIPKSSPASGHRRVDYVSPNTQSIVLQQLDTTPQHNPVGNPLIVNVTANSNGCTNTPGGVTCTTTFPAPAGTFDFSVKTYDQQNGSGNLLSENTLANYTIVAGQANTVAVTLNGVLLSLILPSSISATLSAPQTVLFEPLDPSGATIVGPGTYDNGPLTATGSGITVTPASFTGPGDGTSISVQCLNIGTFMVTFAYQGGSPQTMSVQCSGQPINVTPGSLSFDAVASGPADPTYDQYLSAQDSGPGPITYQWSTVCTPGPGEDPNAQVAIVVNPGGPQAEIRPLNAGTCNVWVQDNYGQQSQPVPIEVHTTVFNVQSKGSRR